MGLGSLDYRSNAQCGGDQHHPHRVWCPHPDDCCGWEDIGLLCHVDGQQWPCSTKREHVTTRRLAASAAGLTKPPVRSPGRPTRRYRVEPRSPE